MNYKWNYQPPTLQEREAARALSREIGISPILCKLLQERGILPQRPNGFSALSLMTSMTRS